MDALGRREELRGEVLVLFWTEKVLTRFWTESDEADREEPRVGVPALFWTESDEGDREKPCGEVPVLFWTEEDKGIGVEEPASADEPCREVAGALVEPA